MAINKSEPYFTVLVTKESGDPYYPRVHVFSFAEYQDAHAFAWHSLKAEGVLRVECFERCNGRKRIPKFAMSNDC